MANPTAATRPSVAWFSNRRLQRNVLLIVALVVLNKLGTPGNLACYGILLVWALRSPAAGVKALSISGLVIMASPFFVSRGFAVGPAKYLLLLVAGFSILRAVRNPFGTRYLGWLMAFSVVAALLSLYNDYYVQISLLKLASFAFGAFCLLNIVNVPRNLAPELTEWAFSLILAVLLMSYAALLLGFGFGTEDPVWGSRFSGYRGFFSHPQAMGVAACLFAVYLSGLALFVAFPRRRLLGWMLVGLLILLYLSQARTGMFGYVLAVFAALLAVGLGNNPPHERRLIKRYQRRFFAFAALGLLGLVLLELATGRVSQDAAQFIFKPKTPHYEFSLEGVYASREGQIEQSWRNFRQSPWTGIGFGTSKDPLWGRNASLFSASTEKGFLPTALLEEVGVAGSFLFGLFVLSLCLYFVRTRRYLGLATFIGLLVVNLGEMMFFAFGGLATLCWAMVCISLTGSNEHIQEFRQAPG